MTAKQAQKVGALYVQVEPRWAPKSYPKFWVVMAPGWVKTITPIQLIAAQGYGRLNPQALAGIAGTQRWHLIDSLLGLRMRRVA